ncbi:MAG: hypothetical protein CL402_09070 [Acidiferrobacteraceae bacterium]|nr:hypothetical protein [Acidiferrobacteraceae bacterium]|tara:strand:+ start:30119 stop:31156 length:1038 start_codon:yes stop_codon:yes gene_type:complete
MTEYSPNMKPNRGSDELIEALRVLESNPLKKLELNQGFFIPIDNLSVLRISGPDAKEFLNAQMTTDVGPLEEGKKSVISGYCNPKGRLIAVILIIRLQNDYILVTDSKILSNLEKKLKIYILRLKVTLNRDNSLIPFGLISSQVSGLIEKIEKHLDPNDSIFSTIMSGFQQARWQNHGGALIIINRSNLASICAIVDEFMFRGTIKQWNLFEIRSGTPRVTTETSEMFIPQSLNLDLLGGVNFQKGCYPGQEIVARVRYLGKIKQRMGRAFISKNPIPAPGELLFLDQSGKKRAGAVVNSASFSTKPGGELLLTVPTEIKLNSKLYWNGSKNAIELTHTPTPNDN